MRHRFGDARPMRSVGDEECGLVHAERIEQPPLLELKKRLPRYTSMTRPSTSVEWP
jgi:hypothetical protein